MSTFKDFFWGSNFAVWEEAIGKTLSRLETQRQKAIDSIYLSTALFNELNDKFGEFTGTSPDEEWSLETFREHLEEIIQSYLIFSSSRRGIEQSVAATTTIPPLFKNINVLQRWLLGFQYLPNRSFQRLDGTVYAEEKEPYAFTDTNKELIITIDGKNPQRIILPIGDKTKEEVIASVNSQIVGGISELYGDRLYIKTNNVTENGSIIVEEASSATSEFGFDNYAHPNSLPPSPDIGFTTASGTLPVDWGVNVTNGGVISEPVNFNEPMFGAGIAELVGENPEPFVGLIIPTFISNTSFESDFTGWTDYDSEFFISTDKFRSGSKSLAVYTVAGEKFSISSERKPIPFGVQTVQITGYHQAELSATVLEGVGDCKWLVSDFVGNSSTIFPTVQLVDSTVNFIASGIKTGMAISVQDGSYGFNGIILGVSQNTLFIDRWLTNDLNDTDISGSGGTVTFTANSIIDTSKDFSALGIQAGADFSTRDKIRVTKVIQQFGQETIKTTTKDIIGITTTTNPNDTLIVDNWEIFIPDDGSAYDMFRRPSDNLPYTIITSIDELGVLLGNSSSVSAQFEYIIKYLSSRGEELFQTRTGPTNLAYRPIPGPTYQQFVISDTVPNNPDDPVFFVQLSVEVAADSTGDGALATIDDVTFVAGEILERGLEFHVAVDSTMQKVTFKNAESPATGTVTYSGTPEDGDTITIGSRYGTATTYEFDYGAHASGVLIYTGNPNDGDVFTVNTETFEFDTISGVLTDSGNTRVTILTNPDDTFFSLAEKVNESFGSLTIARQNPSTSLVRFITKVDGESGDNVVFIKSGTNFSLTPNDGILHGGSGVLFTTSGHIPVHMPVEANPNNDDIFLNFAGLVNISSTDTVSDVDTITNTVTITAKETGPIGDVIVFSGYSSINAFLVNGVNDALGGGTSQKAMGIIRYTGQPTISDTITVGTINYEFNTYFEVTPTVIRIPIGSTADETFTTLSNAIIVYNPIEISSAVPDSTNNEIVLTAYESGTNGNLVVLTASSSIITLPGSTGTLFGGVNSLYADPNALSCQDVIDNINTQTTGLTAYVDPLNRVGIRSNVSGVSSCILVGNGPANEILGFTSAFGKLNDSSTTRPSWKLIVTDDSSSPVTVEVFSKSLQSASKFFGTEWLGRLWVKSTAADARAYMSLDFNPGPTTYSTSGIQLTGSPQPIQLIAKDEGRFEDVEFRLTISGLMPGEEVILADPFLINRIDQSLHLFHNTTPRNKQREYKLYRMRIADSGLSPVEKGLVGILDSTVGETLSLAEGESYFELENTDVFPQSETIRRGGVKARGSLSYFSQPTDGDILIIGSDLYEFDDNLTTAAGNNRVAIGYTLDETFSGLAATVNGVSSFVTANHLISQNTIKFEAQVSGSSGNDIVFASTSDLTIVSLDPLNGKLEGGIDSGTTYSKDTDYTIRYDTGQIKRLANGNIPAVSPEDLVADYAYYPAGIGFKESYTQRVKPAGIKVEPLLTGFFFTHGTKSELDSGSSINFDVVERTPDRFSHLVPSVRGKRVEVLDNFTISGGLFIAELDYRANINFEETNILVSDGISIPVITSGVTEGWRFADDSHIILTSGVFNPTSVYEFEYNTLFQFTTSGIFVPDSDIGWVLLPSSFRATQVDETKNDVEKIILLDENRQSKLSIPAIMDKSISEMERTVGGVSEIISDNEWQFVDEQTIEILLDGFVEGAIYTIRYKASIINFRDLATEIWEYATSADDTTFTTFTEFSPGDVKILDHYVKFRVTVYGDFDVDDYRLRSFNGLADTAQLVECGFGIEDLGALPFDLCGYLGLAPTIPGVEKALAGDLAMAGTVTATETGVSTGTVFITDTPIAK